MAGLPGYLCHWIPVFKRQARTFSAHIALCAGHPVTNALMASHYRIPPRTRRDLTQASSPRRELRHHFGHISAIQTTNSAMAPMAPCHRWWHAGSLDTRTRLGRNSTSHRWCTDRLWILECPALGYVFWLCSSRPALFSEKVAWYKNPPPTHPDQPTICNSSAGARCYCIYTNTRHHGWTYGRNHIANRCPATFQRDQRASQSRTQSACCRVNRLRSTHCHYFRQHR